MRQFTYPKAVTHPSTNRARCTATALIETKLPTRYRYTKPPTWYSSASGVSGYISLPFHCVVWFYSMLTWIYYIERKHAMVARYWYGIYVCPSVRSVCPSHCGVVFKFRYQLKWFSLSPFLLSRVSMHYYACRTRYCNGKLRIMMMMMMMMKTVCLYICLSVCLSVRLWFCIKTNALLVKFFPRAQHRSSGAAV